MRGSAIARKSWRQRRQTAKRRIGTRDDSTPGQSRSWTAAALVGPATIFVAICLLAPLAFLLRYSLNEFIPTKKIVYDGDKMARATPNGQVLLLGSTGGQTIAPAIYAGRLPFDAASFDLVMAYNVLMDLDDMQRALNEARRVLKPDGVIVFQATNRYIDLLPVLKRLAAEFGMEAVNISDSPDATDGPEYWYSATDQVIVTRNRKLLAWPRIDDVSDEIEDRASLPTFTDSHHNLLRILK